MVVLLTWFGIGDIVSGGLPQKLPGYGCSAKSNRYGHDAPLNISFIITQIYLLYSSTRTIISRSNTLSRHTQQKYNSYSIHLQPSIHATRLQAHSLHRHVRPLPLSAPIVHPVIISIIRSPFLPCLYLFNGSAYYLAIDLCQTLVTRHPSFCVRPFLFPFDFFCAYLRIVIARCCMMLTS